MRKRPNIQKEKCDRCGELHPIAHIGKFSAFQLKTPPDNRLGFYFIYKHCIAGK